MAAATILVLFFGHISVANENICVKCGRQIDTGYVRVAMGQNATFGKIQHGGPRHLEIIQTAPSSIWVFDLVSVDDEAIHLRQIWCAHGSAAKITHM